MNAWENPFSIQSNFAREHADMVAMAASDSMITTKVATGLYQRKWMITEEGLKYLRRMGAIET